MTDQRLYCDELDCERLVAGHGRDKCATHLKQLQRNGKTSPIAEKVSPKEHLLNLVNRWAEADSDAEYETAEKAVVIQAKAMGRSSLTSADVADFVKKALSEAARVRIAAARARGVRLGRPPKVDPSEAERLFTLLGRVDLVAQVLRVGPATAWRVLSKLGLLKKRQPESARASGPRPQRGSP